MSELVYSAIRKQDKDQLIETLNKNTENIDQALFIACEKRVPIYIWEILFSHGLDPNLMKSTSPFHQICKTSPSLEIVQLFISNKANIDLQDISKKTPLHEYISKNSPNIEIVKLLCSSINIKMKDNIGRFPLDYFVSGAIDTSDHPFEIFQLLFSENNSFSWIGHSLKKLILLGNWADYIQFCISKMDKKKQKIFIQEIFLRACETTNGNEIIEFCVNSGIDVNSNENLTAIEKAISHGCDDNVTTLLKYQTNFPIQNNETTILHKALNSRISSETFTKILEFSKDVIDLFDKNRQAKTPLMLSINNKKFEQAKILIQNGCDLTLKDKFNESIIHYAARIGSPLEIMKIMFEKGVNLNEKGFYNAAPLHLACRYGNLDNAKFLIEAGAEINALDDYRETPLQGSILGAPRNMIEIVKLLVDCGAEVNLLNIREETALHLLVRSVSNVDITKYLLDNGADPNIQNIEGNTTLHLALRKNRVGLEAIKCLLENGAIWEILNNEGKNAWSYAKKEEVRVLMEKYPSAIQGDFLEFLKRKEFCDLEIDVIGGEKISAHKLIVEARVGRDKMEQFLEILRTMTKEEAEQMMRIVYGGAYMKDKWELELVNQIEEVLGNNWIKLKSETKSLSQDLECLKDSKETKDFTILTEGEVGIKVHRMILVARSELFRGMFLSVKDDSNQVHDYSGKSFETIKEVVSFMYSGYLSQELDPIVLEEMSDAEDYYQLRQKSLSCLLSAYKHKSQKSKKERKEKREQKEEEVKCEIF